MRGTFGLVNANGSGFRFVKNAELRPEAFGARNGRAMANRFSATISTTFTTSISMETF